MSCLSVFDQGIFVKCADPIFQLSDLDLRVGGTLAFEVFEDGAASLRLRIGEERRYLLDSQPFLGRVTSLEPCRSTDPGLKYLRDRPTLRGALTISGLDAPAHGN
jgi:hypothetical protein